MTRVLSSACMVVLLLVMGGKAWAGGKPPIAILGLEVYDNGGGIDPETTKAAKDLTAALRDRAKAGTGTYAPVAAEKELIDEKLLNNCDTEAPPCMAAIGTGLGAEALMYGKIERSTQGNAQIYKVSIKLLNVNRKQLVSSIVETLPLSESTGVRASTHAKAWYAKLTGGSSGGTVVVKANIDRGTVMLDDDAKGNLASGALTLNGVPEGRHTLAIEAKDYQRYETSITVRNGETLPHTATMVEMSRKSTRATKPTGEPLSVEGTVASKSGSGIWKPVLYGTAALEAVAIGYTIYQYKKMRDDANAAMAGKTEADCSGNNGLIESACDHFRNQKIGWVVSSVVGVAVVGSFYMAFIRDRDHTESRSANGGHRKRRELAITPVLSPDGGGATVRFDW
jgi:PEGA domain